MFDDLSNLVQSLEHDYREENGKRVHAYGCRRCAISVRLSTLKKQVILLLKDIQSAIGAANDIES